MVPLFLRPLRHTFPATVTPAGWRTEVPYAVSHVSSSPASWSVGPRSSSGTLPSTLMSSRAVTRRSSSGMSMPGVSPINDQYARTSTWLKCVHYGNVAIMSSLASLHRKLSFWQHPVKNFQNVIVTTSGENSSRWQHFRFSGLSLVSVYWCMGVPRKCICWFHP